MYYKLYKLVAWIKSHWMIIAGIIMAMFVAIGSIQTMRANKWEREHLRLEGKLEEQIKDQDLLFGEAERERATRRLERIQEKEKREKLEIRIRKIIDEGKRAKIALEQEKKKTAILPPTELVRQINKRIGDESSLIEGGLFLFTRLGTNRTLDKFKDGEFHLSEYNKFQGILDDHKAEVASFNTSIGECEEEKEDNFTGWEDCRETLTTAQDDISTLKKVSTAIVWKGRLQGAVGGSVATIVICKILGVF